MSLHKGFSFAEVWLRLLTEVQTGAVVAPRGLQTFELPWVQVEVRDPLTFPLSVVGREFRDVIGVLEGLSLVGEFNVPELFTDRVTKFARFMDDGVLWGAYGQRAHGSLGGVVELLKRDPDSRQAVVTFYDHNRDLNRGKLDIPCTISVQFLLRGDRLDIGVSMRSNDIWLGMPYDFMQFAILQCTVAQALGVRPGKYIHRVGSLHMYSHDVPKAAGLKFESAVPMDYPLWSQFSVGGMQSIARMLSLGEHVPHTPFERWAAHQLSE